MTFDESFKKPGAIPFKWEIRPGVPKIHHHHNTRHHHNRHEPPLSPPEKLKPPPLTPPLASPFLPPHELRTRSFRSTPRTRSERWRLNLNLNLNQHSLARPVCVSPGCFPTPLLKKKESKKTTTTHKPKFKSEQDYGSDMETRSRWSVSSRRSVSPFGEGESPSRSSYYSLDIDSSPRLSVSSRISSRSTPRRRMGDAEWAGFGLF